MYITTTLLASVPLALSYALSTSAAPNLRRASAVNTTTCNGKTYVYEELAGYGFLPSNARDKYGDTLGGFGSSIAMDKSSWKKSGSTYTGILYGLPDRGWNTNGTINYQNRIQKIQISLNAEEPTISNPSGPNVNMKLLDTILLTDFEGTPTTGLDADIAGPYKKFSNVPFTLPSANYTGNGFGGTGNGGNRVSIDSEGLFLGSDGSFWVSDEYGPFVYHFDSSGKMVGAIKPPDALLPRRKGRTSYSADSPPLYDPGLEPTPGNNPTGRNNNQGFEALTTNPDGTKLFVCLQSATNQEAEYVVHLAHVDGDNGGKVAKQSEIHYISDTQFLMLARDSGAGRGQDDTLSVYRHIDVIDISKATNIKGNGNDCYACHIANKAGVLRSSIQPAQYCSWLDFNVNSQLKRYGVHNGGAQNNGLLNEKWESIALLPVNPGDSSSQEYFLFSLSDNDFITQNGYMNFGNFQYSDESGFSLRNQALVFKVTLPAGSSPLVG